MAWTMPAPPNQLIQLLRRQSPMAPAGAIPPPAAFGLQPTPQTVAQNQAVEGGEDNNQPLQPNLGQPGGRPLRPTPDPQPNPAPPPSDDPSLSPVKAPDLGNYLNPILQQQAALNARRAAVPAIDPNAVKPKAWERIVGGLLGATQLRNPENAGAVASQVVNRRLIGAEQARNLALQPINEEQESLDKQMPLYTAAGRSAYEQAQLGLDTNRENRERSTAKGNLNVKSTWNDIRDQRNKDQAEASQGRLDQQKAALEERERNDNERNRLTDRLRTLEEAKRNGGDKRGTPGQFSQTEIKKQQALSKAHADFNKATRDLGLRPTKTDTPDDKATQQVWDEQHQQALDDLNAANQQAQDAYEQEIISLGGTAQHFDYASQGKTRPGNAAPNQGAGEKVNELGGRKVGDVGVVRGQRVRITNIYKNGKFDYEPATGAQ